ncbi:hypothetical protein OWV82_018595 [Melia azedarach]|uniref:Uncharacterized protein n=1 Tax=Melia azedarach TaxID=155640 RepID=A0ACC1XBB4_MELAZ|nr:hypothetical protein OWV82_018595 [Melia azedarach]
MEMTAKDVCASSVVETEREGRSVARSSKKAVRDRGVSRDMVSSFEARLARIELSLGDIHKRLDLLDDRVVKCEMNDAAGVESRLQHAFDAFADSMRFAMDELREMVLAQMDGAYLDSDSKLIQVPHGADFIPQNQHVTFGIRAKLVFCEIVQVERRCVQGSKRMGKERVVSKEMIDSLDARLARVENSLGDIHKRLDFFDDRDDVEWVSQDGCMEFTMRGSDTRCRSRGFVWATGFCRLSRLCGERRLACHSARKMVLRLQGLVVQGKVEASYRDCRNDFREGVKLITPADQCLTAQHRQHSTSAASLEMQCADFVPVNAGSSEAQWTELKSSRGSLTRASSIPVGEGVTGRRGASGDVATQRHISVQAPARGHGCYAFRRSSAQAEWFAGEQCCR